MIVVLQSSLSCFHVVEPFERVRKLRQFPFELRWEDTVHGDDAMDVVAVVPGSHTVDAAAVESLCAKYPNLRHIALPMTGDDGLDKIACASHGIGHSRVLGYSTGEMAEYAETLVLTLRHEILPKAMAMRTGRWQDTPTVQMRGAVVGVLGLGTIGIATARRFAGRGCQLIGWSRTTKWEFEDLGGRQVSLEELFSTAQVLVVHIPLVQGRHGTEGLVSRELIAMMGAADLVNVSRADLIDGDALLSAVLERRLHGVALDVFHPEPPFDSGNAWSKLCSLDPGEYNLVCQPHMGFKKERSLERLVEGVLANISAAGL